MKLETILRNLIIGKNRFVDSFPQYKQAMLSGRLAMIAMAILIVNCLLEDTLGWAVLTYVISILILAFSICLHRFSKHTLANYVLLITANFTTYLFASSEPIGTCICIFFVVISIGAFVLMSSGNRWEAIFFAVLSFLFFYLSYFVNFRILPWRDYSNEQIMFVAIVNMSAAIISSGMGVSLLIRLNNKSAGELCENNKLLMKTNAELDRFVYSTSHDLRAPLASVMGLINIASNVQDIHELRRYLGLMKGRVNSLDSFIKDITDYSRNNRKEVGRESVRLKELALEVWEDLKFASEASHIFFDVQIDDAIEVTSDRKRLRVILSNLISNAVRYHDGRKDTQYVRLCYKCTNKEFYLSVEDNGQGIAEEYHHKIFDMFFRGNEDSKGSGLGLYIVKETLGKLSGTISLNSRCGTGSCFTISIPTSM